MEIFIQALVQAGGYACLCGALIWLVSVQIASLSAAVRELASAVARLDARLSGPGEAR